MDIVAFLMILILVIVAFKVAAVIFKTAFFLISIPLQIVLFVGLSLIMVALLPAMIITGLTAIFMIPYAFLGPLLPFILVLLGLYLVLKK